jgi:hypothetical protein
MQLRKYQLRQGFPMLLLPLRMKLLLQQMLSLRLKPTLSLRLKPTLRQLLEGQGVADLGHVSLCYFVQDTIQSWQHTHTKPVA